MPSAVRSCVQTQHSQMNHTSEEKEYTRCHGFRFSFTSLRYSTWCLVAANTTVCSWGFTTFLNRWSRRAGLSSSRRWKNETWWRDETDQRRTHNLQIILTDVCSSHLQLIAQFSVHIQTNENRFCEAWNTHGVKTPVTDVMTRSEPYDTKRTGSGELHQQFGQRGWEEQRLSSVWKTSDDLLQLIRETHFKQPEHTNDPGSV